MRKEASTAEKMGGLVGYLHQITRENPRVGSSREGESKSVFSNVENVVGRDVRIVGSVRFERSLSVHGEVRGDVSGGGLLHVGREGRLDGDVSAMSVVVEGQVRGKLWAGERVELREGARCEGEIRTVVLVAAPGAIFNGPVSVGAGGAEMPQAASSIRPGERRL